MDKTKREILMHCIMSYIGGIFAIYALLEHSNVFGSAETSNMILLVGDLLNFNIYTIAIRLGSLLVYAAGIICAAWLAKYHSDIKKILCIVFDCFAVVILSFLPNSTPPVVALYPVAFSMSVQWCTFKGVCDNPSATTFSTGNFRQLVMNTFNYFTSKDKKNLFRIKFYLTTMLSFHSGVATIYIFHPHATRQSICIAFVPLMLAAVFEIKSIFLHIRQRDLLSQDAGCEDV